MSSRRILSLWFPRLGVDRVLRARPELAGKALAVAGAVGGREQVTFVSALAEQAGLRRGMGLADARAILPDLVVAPHEESADARMLTALARWAGQFSPLVGTEPPEALFLDIGGVTRIFGGEAGLLEKLQIEAENLQLSLRFGLADTPGAAWALARYAGRHQVTEPAAGDAIDGEARATRSRAAKRRRGWAQNVEAAPRGMAGPGPVAPPGQAFAALADLPVAALRLDAQTVETLHTLGLRRIGEVAGQPRASLARRFGQALVLRLDQALGRQFEPITPHHDTPPLAVRLSLPEPIGLEEDIRAAIERLLARLCTRLEEAGKGARALVLEAYLAEGGVARLPVRLARAQRDPDHIRPLLLLKLPQIDAGFGIDRLRLAVTEEVPWQDRAPAGHLDASRAMRSTQARQVALDDLIGRLGARLGPEAVWRWHPAESHLPDHTARRMVAALSAPIDHWPLPLRSRPLLLWPAAMLSSPLSATPPASFKWAGRTRRVIDAHGPERIAPEWWLDRPEWRGGARDYWWLIDEAGNRLWAFLAHGGDMRGGWFIHGAAG